jgi:hypothetical protein
VLLGAIDLGDQLGLVDIDEAERRREVVRATLEDLDRRPPAPAEKD